MDKLISCLMAIIGFAKDIHYSCKNDAFYSKHLLADKIIDDIDDYLDRIKEEILLADDIIPKSTAEYYKMASDLMPTRDNDDIENFSKLKILVIETLSHIENITEKDTLTRGDMNLLDDIANNLQAKLGLINLQIKEG